MHFVQKNDDVCGELSYTSDNHIFGASGLTQFSRNWTFGGEVYYTAKEKSGGLSIGTRLNTRIKDGLEATTTLIANPIMGHFSSSYAADVTPTIRMATKYDFNMYSYDSDLSFGMEFEPPHQQQTLKASVSLMNVSLIHLGDFFCFIGIFSTHSIHDWNGNHIRLQPTTKLWALPRNFLNIVTDINYETRV
jgi:hypothetical protein